jgi:hypothetical protein
MKLLKNNPHVLEIVFSTRAKPGAPYLKKIGLPAAM